MAKTRKPSQAQRPEVDKRKLPKSKRDIDRFVDQLDDNRVDIQKDNARDFPREWFE